jgi:hypothetical protein
MCHAAAAHLQASIQLGAVQEGFQGVSHVDAGVVGEAAVFAVHAEHA